MNDLPVDVVGTVFCFFDVKEVSIASSVCRRLRRETFDSNVFWFRYLVETYLLRRICDRSVHRGPVTIDCFLSDKFSDKLNVQDRARGMQCKSVHDLSLFTVEEVQAMLRDAFFDEARSTSSVHGSLCEKSIDVHELSRHVKHWLSIGLGTKCMFSLPDLAPIFPSYWTSNRLKCFHLSHYDNLDRSPKLYMRANKSNPSSVVLRQLPSLSCFIPDVHYREVLFEDMFIKLRNQKWNREEDCELFSLFDQVQKAFITLRRIGPRLVEASHKRERAMALFRVLPGHCSDDQDLRSSDRVQSFADGVERILAIIKEISPKTGGASSQ